MKKGIGIAFLILGAFAFIGLINSYLNSKNDIEGALIAFLVQTTIGVILIISAKKDNERKIKQQIEYNKRIQQKEVKENEVLEQKFKKVDELNENIEELEKISVLEINDFKEIIIENEKKIIEKGNESQLFIFLKLDSFLKEYQNQIVKDKEELRKLIDVDSLKNKIKNDSKRNEIDKLQENLQSNLAKMEGKNPTGFDANLEALFKNGSLLKISMENQIKTLEFYKNMSIAMTTFYLDDKKIRYYEIYEAFEKLGVFDSTWQKNVLNKLDRIEIRLTHINNQLTELNQNFVLLVESCQNLTTELKEINNNIVTNNMLQAIIAYQTWRINKNTKILNN
ncbi:hypothetical protein [Flavobacterium sp.]|uniref:hypothetical protein n=2 Tax=Flavobacterium sp. TaxID=239 RepID=UPI0040476BDC